MVHDKICILVYALQTRHEMPVRKDAQRTKLLMRPSVGCNRHLGKAPFRYCSR